MLTSLHHCCRLPLPFSRNEFPANTPRYLWLQIKGIQNRVTLAVPASANHDMPLQAPYHRLPLLMKCPVSLHSKQCYPSMRLPGVPYHSHLLRQALLRQVLLTSYYQPSPCCTLANKFVTTTTLTTHLFMFDSDPFKYVMQTSIQQL